MTPILGRIVLLPYTSAPNGWAFCDGRTLYIGESFELFQLLGTNFGGDGAETFALPNLKAPNGCHYCISLGGYPPNEFQEMLIGQTMIWATSKQPNSLVECAGQPLPVRQYMMLNQYMGTRFGGDANNFQMPNLRSIAPNNCRYLMATSGNDPRFLRDAAFVGEIFLLPYEASPDATGLRLCNGDKLKVKDNTALFSLLGKRFGGDGQETFGLPNLASAAPSKFNYYISLQGVFSPPGD
jgi:microcystin-dependent protein